MVDFRLCLITNRNLLASDKLVDRVATLAKAGLPAVQLREKDLGGRELCALARALRSVTMEFGTKLIVNERADIASAVDANGLHAAQNSWPIQDARRVVGSRMIGKSTHSLQEAMAAEEEGADYIIFGPIYDTTSKRQYGEPQGLEKLKEVARKVGIPVMALGGIDPNRAAQCLDAGAFGVAVMSDLLCCVKPEARLDEYQKIFERK